MRLDEEGQSRATALVSVDQTGVGPRQSAGVEATSSGVDLVGSGEAVRPSAQNDARPPSHRTRRLLGLFFGCRLSITAALCAGETRRSCEVLEREAVRALTEQKMSPKLPRAVATSLAGAATPSREAWC